MIKTASFSLVLLCMLLLGSCDIELDFDDCIDGNGSSITETRIVDPFIAISTDDNFNVELRHGTEYRIEIEGESNIVEELITTVEQNTLLLRFGIRNCISMRGDLKVIVYYPVGTLEALDLGGSGNIQGDSIIGDFVNLFLLGSGNMDLRVRSKRIKATVTGSGNINLKGKADDADFKVTGSGELDALSFVCQTADIEMIGSGNAYLFVEKRLEATVTGSGTVFYLGNPELISEINGSGNVSRY